MERKALKKWNYEKQAYEEVTVPPGDYILWSFDMDVEVTCPHCGKKFKFGDGISSRVFHGPHGLGYPVCQDCYNNIEFPEYSNYEKNKRKQER